MVSKARAWKQTSPCEALAWNWYVTLPPLSLGQHKSQTSFKGWENRIFKITLKRAWPEFGIENWDHCYNQSMISPLLFPHLIWPDFCSWADHFMGNLARKGHWISAPTEMSSADNVIWKCVSEREGLWNFCRWFYFICFVIKKKKKIMSEKLFLFEEEDKSITAK